MKGGGGVGVDKRWHHWHAWKYGEWVDEDEIEVYTTTESMDFSSTKGTFPTKGAREGDRAKTIAEQWQLKDYKVPFVKEKSADSAVREYISWWLL